MLDQTTYANTHNATSSQESEDGHSPCVLQNGQTIDLFGQAPVHASPIPSLQLVMAARKAKAMADIYGRLSPISSKSVILQRSLESKLLAQSNGDGGIKQQWTLKPKATPARRAYCEQIPMEQTTRGNGSTGWPTPAARDGKDISRSTAFLSQRLRHSPSMATRLQERGAPWTVITAIYCIAMGYPSCWNDMRPKATEMQSSRKQRQLLSSQLAKQSTKEST